VVVATGMQTEIGRIADMLEEQVEPVSPLRRQLLQFVK
jgi:magnesium-transporting ATPase (P-type)